MVAVLLSALREVHWSRFWCWRPRLDAGRLFGSAHSSLYSCAASSMRIVKPFPRWSPFPAKCTCAIYIYIYALTWKFRCKLRVRDAGVLFMRFCVYITNYNTENIAELVSSLTTIIYKLGGRGFMLNLRFSLMVGGLWVVDGWSSEACYE